MRSAPHGADLPAAPTSELIAAVEQFATVAVVRGLPVSGTPVRAVESLTNFVYSAGRAEWVAKYSVLGLSKPSLVRWVGAVGGDLGRLAAAQREYLAGGDTEVHREMDGLRLLTRRVGPYFPEVRSCVNGVLVTRPEPDATPLSTLLHDGDPQALQQVGAVQELVAAIWATDAAGISDREHRSLLATGQRGIVATFASKFASFGSERYLRGLGLPGRWVGVALRLAPGLLETADGRPAPSLIFGDLKPEHVLVHHGRPPVLLDPALQYGDPAADLARFVCRVVLDGVSGAPRSGRDELAAHVVATVLQSRAAGRSTPRIGALIAMDALNILSTRTALARAEVDAPGWPTFPLAPGQLRGMLAILDRGDLPGTRAWRRPVELCRSMTARLPAGPAVAGDPPEPAPGLRACRGAGPTTRPGPGPSPEGAPSDQPARTAPSP